MNLLNRLQTAGNESVVQHTILEVIQKHFQDVIVDFSNHSDGLIKLDNKNNYLLCEFKYDEDLSSKMTRARIILQAVFYMKKLEMEGRIVPSVLLVADKDEAFILHTNRLNKYLSMDLDWTKAASTAYSRHPEIVQEMAEDVELMSKIWVDNLDSDGKILNIPIMVERAKSTVQRKVRIHPLNIHVIFDDFKERVLKDWRTLGANKAVGVFMSCLLDTENNDLHPRNGYFMWYNPLNKEDVRIEVNPEMFIAFWAHFDREQYSISEKERLIAMSDEIIEETNRRFKGEYYTPAIWVEEAHKEIAKVYGENWKEEYVVWDCACGTGNLTRGYEFKELYMSTLNESDLIQAGYGNENATRFKFDFLNDQDDVLPKQLRIALKQKKVIFMINPPYATSCNLAGSENKAGVTDGFTKQHMDADGLGRAKEQLYAHFLYRISKWKEDNENIHLGLFSPVSFLTTNAFENFRNFFLKRMEYKYGMIFKASHFADVSDSWGIGFTIWN